MRSVERNHDNYYINLRHVAAQHLSQTRFASGRGRTTVNR